MEIGLDIQNKPRMTRENCNKNVRVSRSKPCVFGLIY